MIPIAEILPENNWREVWHHNAHLGGKCYSAPMKHLPDRLPIEDGNVLRLYECTGCGEQVFAGLDARRRLVSRPALEATTGWSPEIGGEW